MKTGIPLLWLLAVLGLSLNALAQNDQQNTQAASTAQSQPADQSNGDQTTTDDQKSKQKIKHTGGKDDVDAIGNRKVGGMDWYSIEKEVAMGNQYAQQLEQQVRLIKDPIVTEYINRIGQNLVRNSDSKIPFTFKVLDDDTLNAVTIPGGHVYVNSGLILAADDEDELAGAMAHEIAHVAARHGTRQATRAQLANLLSIPLIAVGGIPGLIVQEGAGFALPATFLKFSRGFEAEADYLGIQYAYKAGYDPGGMITMFEKIEAMEKKRPGSMAKIFSDHPQTPDRVGKSQKEIATILPERDQYIITTSEFSQVKARLAAIENRRKLDDQNNPDKPALRRAADNPSKDGSKDGNSKDDDRPVLHRTPDHLAGQ